jgi:hypothetical protein
MHISWLRLSGDNKQFLSQQFLWIGISLGISLAISFLVPFPYSLPIIMAVFILLSFYVRKRSLKRMGMSGASMFGYSSLNYYCMSCGTKHNQSSCPKCGSKMKRVGSWRGWTFNGKWAKRLWSEDGKIKNALTVLIYKYSKKTSIR